MNTDQLHGVGSNAIEAAMQWLQATLLGSLATSIAIIAVASTGFLLMSGRMGVRRGAQVIFGCFILFGASSIAAGILRVTDGRSSSVEASPTQPTSPLIPPPAATKPIPYDPYAGAALPTRN